MWRYILQNIFPKIKPVNVTVERIKSDSLLPAQEGELRIGVQEQLQLQGI